MEILNADAFDIIDNMKDRSFDLIILDPDYQDWAGFIKRGLIEKCMQKLADDGNLITFTKQPFDYDLRIAVNDYFRREIIWTFDNGGAWVSNRMPLVSFQKIFLCVKGKDSFFKVALEKNRDVIAIEKDEERCHAIIDMLMTEGGAS